jgi:hypothetical protein
MFHKFFLHSSLLFIFQFRFRLFIQSNPTIRLFSFFFSFYHLIFRRSVSDVGILKEFQNLFRLKSLGEDMLDSLVLLSSMTLDLTSFVAGSFLSYVDAIPLLGDVLFIVP